MKPLLLAALGAVLASPAYAETVWLGNVFITAAAQPACGTTAAVGDFARLLYRPAGAALGNTGDSYLAYVGSRANVTMVAYKGLFGASVNYGGQYVGSHLTIASFTGAVTAWSLTPSVISASTTHYTLTATLTKFYNVAGCTVSLQADLEKAP